MITHTEWTELKTLGAGTYGTVTLAKDARTIDVSINDRTGGHFVVKRLHPYKVESTSVCSRSGFVLLFYSNIEYVNHHCVVASVLHDDVVTACCCTLREAVKGLQQEITTLARLSHTNIVK